MSIDMVRFAMCTRFARRWHNICRYYTMSSKQVKVNFS